MYPAANLTPLATILTMGTGQAINTQVDIGFRFPEQTGRGGLSLLANFGIMILDSLKGM